MLKTNNLVSAYRFENSGTCWAASGRNITVYGAAYADGKFGRCLSFDGVDDYGQFSSAYTFALNHTICLWIKFYNDSSSKCFLGSTTTPCIRYNNTSFLVNAGGTGQTGVNWTNPDTWVHLAIIRKALQDYDIYINGALIGTADSNNDANISFSFLGRRNSTSPELYFKGLIDELQFFNTKLSNENIRRVMHGFHPL